MPGRGRTFALLCGVLLACSKASTPGPCTPGADTSWMTAAYDTVAPYCMVRIENGNVVVEPGVMPYDLNTPLFSDRAVKVRTVFVPTGQTIAYDDTLAFDLPVGSIVTKSFGFKDDFRKAQPLIHWIETRVMLRRADGWHGQAYEWNEAQTEANFLAGGGVRSIHWIDEDGNAAGTDSYLIPALNQCRNCHVLDDVTTLIGPKARNLNRDFAYSDGTENQLARWTRTGLLTGAPDPAAAPKLAVWNDPSTGSLDQRSRAYLETNCAHCHNAGGAARTTGLFLLTSETDPTHLGICKQPVAAGPGSGGHDFDVVPGDADASIMPYRMSQTTTPAVMPQIGRSVVDTVGLQLIRDWINAQSGGCP